MRLPLRMSRTFGESELVEGRIVVGFYHDGVQVAQGGSTLMGPQGGTLNQDGLTLTFDQGAFSGSTLVRLNVIPGDPAALWADVAGKGAIVKSFQVDIVGQLFKGMRLRIAGLGSQAQMPLLVQRRVVQGQRLVVAVGGLQPVAGSLGDWELAIPAEGNPLMEGGSFAVLIPTQTWAWVTGTAVMDPRLAQSSKARASAAKSLRLAPMVVGEPTPVGDAVVQAGYLPAVSGLDGHFAVPAFTTPATNTLQGQRWDLGVSGSLDAAVPSSGNRLQLSSVPFQVVTALPAEGAQVAPGSVLTLLLSGPADPMTTGNVRLYRVVSVAQVAPASLKATVKKGTSPSAAVKSKAKPKVPAKASTKGTKTALLLQEPTPTELVEVVLRRNLSQDGKTLLLVPEQPLPLGHAFQLQVEGLQGLSGEAAPKLLRRFRTASVPEKGVVDFSRIKLNYPDESFTITATIPVGAVPPKAVVQLEAPGMGSVGTGVMVETQDLLFQMKAGLGERLHARVQLFSGEVIEGWIGRYESSDGSGRVTLGVDGGRVEAPDGSGAAVTLPGGALDAPVELKVESVGVPEGLDPEVAQRERLVGGLRLTGDRPVELKKRPTLELPAPPNPTTLTHEGGLGAYAVFYEVNGFEEDGTPAVFYEINDTAAVEGGKLRSKGGITDPSTGQPLNPAMPPGLARIIPTPKASTAVSPGMNAGAPERSFIAGGFGLLTAMSIDSGEHYLYGGASIRIGEGDWEPASGAYIFATGNGTMVSPRRAGQMIARTNALGRYMTASSLTGELIRGGAKLFGVDADYGVTASAGAGAIGSYGVFGTILHASHMDFVVPPTQLEDRTAPYAELSFEVKDPSGRFSPVAFSRPGDRLYAVVRAKDNRTPELSLNLDLSVDEVRHPACTSACGSIPDWSRMEALDRTDRRGLTTYRFPLEVPGEGSHVVRLAALDKACNRQEITKDLLVVSFDTDPADQPDQAPKAALKVDLDETAARADSPVGLRFSEPVKGVSKDSLFLEVQENGAWVKEPVKILGKQGEVTADQWVGQVVFQLPGRLKLASSYRVSWTAAIVDAEGKGLSGDFLTFRTVGWKIGPSFAVGLPMGKVVVTGNRAFVVERLGQKNRIGEYWLSNGAWERIGELGEDSTHTFYGQQVAEMEVFEQVPLGDGSAPAVLLLATQPSALEYQSVLWAYKVCDPGGPELLFAVSLGPGVSGYTPSLDCRDGVIVAGRLVSSMQLIDVAKAYGAWKGMTADQRNLVRHPGGANHQAVFQSFWLGNPENKQVGTWFPGVHKHVRLLPAQAGGETAFRVAVGYSQISANGWDSLSGLSTSIHPYTPGAAYYPQPPFVGGPVNGDPDLRAHGTEGFNPTAGLYPFEVVSGVTIDDADGPRAATLVVGMAIGDKSLVVVDVTKAEQPKRLATVNAPEGNTFVRTRGSFSFDPATNWIGLRMKRSTQTEWGILDVNDPLHPRLLARVPVEAQTGVLRDGKFYLVGNDGVRVVELLEGGQAMVRNVVFAKTFPGKPEKSTILTEEKSKCAPPAVVEIKSAQAQVPAKTKHSMDFNQQSWDKDRFVFMMEGRRPSPKLLYPGGKRVSILSMPNLEASKGQVKTHPYPRYYILKIAIPRDPKNPRPDLWKEVRLDVSMSIGSQTWELAKDLIPGTDLGRLSRLPGEFDNVGGIKGDPFVWRGKSREEDQTPTHEVHYFKALVTSDSQAGFKFPTSSTPPGDQAVITFTAKMGEMTNQITSDATNTQLVHWPAPDSLWDRGLIADNDKTIGGDYWCSPALHQIFAGWTKDTGSVPSWLRKINDISLIHGGWHRGEHASGDEFDMLNFKSFDGSDGSLAYQRLCNALKYVSEKPETDPERQKNIQALKAWVEGTRKDILKIREEEEELRKFIYLPTGSPVLDLLMKGSIEDFYTYWDTKQLHYQESLEVDLGLGKFDMGNSSVSWKKDTRWGGTALLRPVRNLPSASGNIPFAPELVVPGDTLLIPAKAFVGLAEVGFLVDAKGTLTWMGVTFLPAVQARSASYQVLVPAGAVTGQIQFRKGPADKSPVLSQTPLYVLRPMVLSNSVGQVFVAGESDVDGTELTLTVPGPGVSLKAEDCEVWMPGDQGWVQLTDLDVAGRPDQLRVRIPAHAFSGRVLLKQGPAYFALSGSDLLVQLPAKPAHHHHVHVQAENPNSPFQ